MPDAVLMLVFPNSELIDNPGCFINTQIYAVDDFLIEETKQFFYSTGNIIRNREHYSFLRNDQT